MPLHPKSAVSLTDGADLETALRIDANRPRRQDNAVAYIVIESDPGAHDTAWLEDSQAMLKALAGAKSNFQAPGALSAYRTPTDQLVVRLDQRYLPKGTDIDNAAAAFVKGIHTELHGYRTNKNVRVVTRIARDRNASRIVIDEYRLLGMILNKELSNKLRFTTRFPNLAPLLPNPDLSAELTRYAKARRSDASVRTPVTFAVVGWRNQASNKGVSLEARINITRSVREVAHSMTNGDRTNDWVKLFQSRSGQLVIRFDHSGMEGAPSAQALTFVRMLTTQMQKAVSHLDDAPKIGVAFRILSAADDFALIRQEHEGAGIMLRGELRDAGVPTQPEHGQTTPAMDSPR